MSTAKFGESLRFRDKLEKSVQRGFGLCVGLDPVFEKLPEKFRADNEPLYAFNLEIIEATLDYASAYKPNLAFYEAHGADGWRQLEKTIKAIPDDKVVIGDAKRGDIGNTARAYAKSLFTKLGCDAATVSPYLGSDSLEPFTQDERKGAYVLAITSNPGGKELQELLVDGKAVYRYVIQMAQRLSNSGNVGLVIGATKPDLWQELLEVISDMPLLIPGVGTQGGDLGALKTALKDYKAPVLVNASRSIIYASTGADFKSAARDAASSLKADLTS